MAFSLVTSTSGQPTTSAIDTTGATFIVIVVAYDSSAIVTDSKSNVWSGRTSASGYCRIWYCENPTVGTGHTFTVSVSTGWIGVEAYTGQATSCYDVEAPGILTSGNAAYAGSATPTENNELLIAGINAPGTCSIDSGFTISNQLAGVTGVNYGGAMAHKIQTTAGAENPGWSWTNSGGAAAVMATFKASTYVPVYRRALYLA